MRVTIAVFAVAFLSALQPASAQGSGPSGPPKEIDQLKVFHGAWMCTGHAPEGPLGPAHDSTTSVKFEKDLDGFWYTGRVEEVSAKGNPRPLKGTAHWTYDTSKKAYLAVWIDNFGAFMTQTASGWEGDRMVWLGEGAMDGKPMVARDTFTKKGADLHHLGEFKIDDKWFVVQDEICKRSAAGK